MEEEKPVKRKRDESEMQLVTPLKTLQNSLPRYLLQLEYNGSSFSGYQRQTGAKTVQGYVEAALKKFLGSDTLISISSRTDAGVHAICNTAHVDICRTSKRKPGETLEPYPPETVRRALNHFLKLSSPDVSIIGVKRVSPFFHARHNAIGRTYYYRIQTGESQQPSIFEQGRVWHVPAQLDIEKMQAATRHIIGRQDFSTFRAAGCQSKSPIRTLEMLEIRSCPTWSALPSSEASARVESFVIITKARSYLYHQVRLMVGLLKAVGLGEISVDEIPGLIEKRTPHVLPPMAPACGLFLGDVHYRDECMAMDYVYHHHLREECTAGENGSSD